MRKIPKPEPDEYGSYAKWYLDLMPDDGFVLEHMQRNLTLITELVAPMPDERLTHRFSENEWSIKEILVHVIDTERVLAYRALRFARNDPTELPGFEQEDYAAHSGANIRPLQCILEEYVAVRAATITLFNGFEEDALLRSGVANGQKISVRTIAYYIAGHELHHINSIKENYL